MMRAVVVVGVAAAALACAGGAPVPVDDVPPAIAEACPADLPAAVGQTCKTEGQICSTPASELRLIECARGKWVEMEAPPPPSPQ